MALNTSSIMAFQDFAELHALEKIISMFVKDNEKYQSLVEKVPTVIHQGIRNATELWKSNLFSIMMLDHLLMFDEACQSGVNDNMVQIMIENACINALAYKNSFHNAAATHSWNRQHIENMAETNLISCMLINRPEYTCKTLSPAVCLISVEKNGVLYAGTAFIISMDMGKSKRRIIQTVKHNVDPKDNVKIELIKTSSGVIIDHEILDWCISDDKDLAFALLPDYEGPFFSLSPFSMVLTETLSLGYPRVPLTKGNYLLAHRGEINAKVESYAQPGNHLLISNLTSPGSSGSPIINLTGFVVGIATSSFISKSTEEEPAIQMQAALDVSEIVAFYFSRFDTTG